MVQPVQFEVDWVAVVDDDESIRRCLSRLLLMHGINVRTFASAEEYLVGVGTDMPRCLVLDVQLTGLSGFELQDRLRTEGRVPPIVFITAMADAPVEEMAARSRGTRCLRKPFDAQALLDVVRPHVC